MGTVLQGDGPFRPRCLPPRVQSLGDRFLSPQSAVGEIKSVNFVPINLSMCRWRPPAFEHSRTAVSLLLSSTMDGVQIAPAMATSAAQTEASPVATATEFR